MKTIGDILAEPTRPDAFDSERCPHGGAKCALVSDGNGNHACRTCGTCFVISVTYRGDWHGAWPWDTRP